jgi:hypothetical protein
MSGTEVISEEARAYERRERTRLMAAIRYQATKLDPIAMEINRERSLAYYNARKHDPEFMAKRNAAVKAHYARYPEKRPKAKPRQRKASAGSEEDPAAADN